MDLIASQTSLDRTKSAGFGLVELLLTVFILALVMTGFGAILMASARESVAAERRTVAQQLASSEVETLRGLQYEALGTVGGNPPGTVPATKTVDGFTVKIKVSFVADNVPGTFQTYRDYKSVKVTVIEPTTDTTFATFETKVAPPGAPGLNEAVVKVTVSDYHLNTPIEGATVSLNGGPSSDRSDDATAAGEVVFPGLVANTNTGTTSPYDVTATAPGYATLPADLPPASATRIRVAPTTVFSTAIRMFRQISLNVNLHKDDGGASVPFGQAASVGISGPQVYGFEPTNPTGTLTTSTVGGKPIVPTETYAFSAFAPSTGGRGWFGGGVHEKVPVDYPTTLTHSVALTMQEHDLGHVRVKVVDATNKPLENIVVTISGGPADITFTGATNAGGTLMFTVPEKNAPDAYTITVPGQGGFTERVLTSDAQGSISVVVVTLD